MHNINSLCNRYYVPLVFRMLPGKSESIYRSMWSAIRSLCERRDFTIEPTAILKYFEEYMHTVLKNAQSTFKNELIASCYAFQLA